MICTFVTNSEMPCFRTPHPTIWLDALKRLTLAKNEEETLKAGAKKYATNAANPSPGFLNPGLLKYICHFR